MSNETTEQQCGCSQQLSSITLLVAVSYTHLDVYKRQGLLRPDGIKNRCGLHPCHILVNRFPTGRTYRTERQNHHSTGHDRHRDIHRHDRGTPVGTDHRPVSQLANNIRLHSRRRFSRFPATDHHFPESPERQPLPAGRTAFPA